MNWLAWSEKYSSTSCSALLIAPMVVMANTPRWERMSSGWGSASLMQPMALVPWKWSSSFSKRVRNGAFSMEWIWRWNPAAWSRTTMPARLVPKWEW